MSIKKFDKYSSKRYPFPNSDIDPKEKATKDYARSFAEAMYSMLFIGGLESGYSDFSRYRQARRYGRGNQSEEGYKDYFKGDDQTTASSIGSDGTDLDGEGSSNYKRKGYGNMRWDIISPAQKISSQIHGNLDELDYRIMLDRIDSDSGDEEENAKWDLWVEASQKGFIDEFRNNAGIPGDDVDFIPANQQELDIYAAAGGFKPNYIKAMQKLLAHTENISDYQNIKEKHIDDLRDIGKIFMQDYFDEHTGKSKCRYVDPENFVGQYTRRHNYKDSAYAGEWKIQSIFEVMDVLLEEYPDITEDDIKNLSKIYSGYEGNPEESEYESLTKDNDRWWENTKVCVLDFEWIENDKEYIVKSTTKKGNKRSYKGEYGKVMDTEGKKTKVNMKRNRYRGKWIVGTTYVFDYGLDYDQQRPSQGEVNLTYQGFKIEGKPLTMQLAPIYDQIQIGWLKFQNALATHFDDVWAIDMRMIGNVSDGKGKSIGVQEIIGMMKELKAVPFMSSPAGQGYQGGGVTPVVKIPGTLMKDINEYLTYINSQLQLIENIVGLNSVALGGAVDPNNPVKTTQMAVEAVSKGMKPYINAIFKLKEMTSKNLVLRMQLGAKYNSSFKKTYAPVVGEVDIDLIKKAQHTNTQYGLTLKAKPDDQKKLSLHQAIQNAGKEGSLTSAQIMWMDSALDDGEDLIEIAQKLDYQINKAKEQAEAAQEQAIVRQQEEVLKQRQIEQQTKQEQFQMEYKREMDAIRMKAEEERRTITHQANLKYMEGLEEAASLEEGQNVEVNKELAKNVLE